MRTRELKAGANPSVTAGAVRRRCAPQMPLLPTTITRPLGRLGAAAQNALEVARFGGLATDETPSPYELASEQRVYRLRHYYPDREAAPPILLVPPLMLAAEVYDVAPN